jgi:hypothetical protein
LFNGVFQLLFEQRERLFSLYLGVQFGGKLLLSNGYAVVAGNNLLSGLQ